MRRGVLALALLAALAACSDGILAADDPVPGDAAPGDGDDGVGDGDGHGQPDAGSVGVSEEELAGEYLGEPLPPGTPPPCGPLDLEVSYDAPARLAGGRFELQEARADGVVETAPPDAHVVSDLRFDDPQVFGGPRAENAVVGPGASRYTVDDAAYYGFRLMIPAGWVEDGGNEDIVFQWHSLADTALGETSKSPHIFLAVKRDELVLRVTHDANQVSTATSPTRLQFPVLDGMDLSTSTWHHLVVRVDWSYRPGEGRTKVWHKREADAAYHLVVDEAGPNMHNDALAGYLKWGIYKPSWRAGATAASRRTVHHDDIRVGPSFEAVRPDASACR
jgi:hypothetical protein